MPYIVHEQYSVMYKCSQKDTLDSTVGTIVIIINNGRYINTLYTSCDYTTIISRYLFIIGEIEF